jgi:two-component SAPR family response regulator
VEVRVLGPVEVLAGDGRVIRLPARQLRLLAALTVREGEACSADSLIEALWEASPPARGRKALQLYGSRLRKALPDARITTNGSAYTLELDDESLDSARFERLLAEARTSAAEGNDRLALSLLDQGLSLWRGGAYGELTHEVVLGLLERAAVVDHLIHQVARVELAGTDVDERRLRLLFRRRVREDDHLAQPRGSGWAAPCQ